MLLRQIQFFVSIAEENSFTKAAVKHYVSQSAISQAVQALEADLGVQLLERKNRRFHLTPAGEYFYRKSKAVLKELETVRRETQRMGNDGEMRLNVGYINLYAGPELSDALAEFSALYPEVHISVRSGTHEALYRGMLDSTLDLALNDQRRAFSDAFVNLELKNAACFVEVPKLSFLSQFDRLEISDLTGVSCIIVSSPDQRQTEAEYYRNVLGFTSDFIFAETQEEARLMVIGNQGFLPVEAVGKLPEPAQAVTRVPLFRKNRRVTRKYCLFWLEERSNYYIEEFAEMLRRRLS